MKKGNCGEANPGSLLNFRKYTSAVFIQLGISLMRVAQLVVMRCPIHFIGMIGCFSPGKSQQPEIKCCLKVCIRPQNEFILLSFYLAAMVRKKRLIIKYGLFWLLGLLMLALFFRPKTLKQRLQGVVLVETQSRYMLPLADGDTLYFTSHRDFDGISGVGLWDVPTNNLSYSSGFYVSEEGHIVSVLPDTLELPRRLSGKSLRDILQREYDRLKTLDKVYSGQKKELAYYTRTHSVVDDGFHQMMAFRQSLEVRSAELDSVKLLLQTALEDSSLSVAVLQCRYRVLDHLGDSVWMQASGLFADTSQPLVLLQRSDRLTPVPFASWHVPLLCSWINTQLGLPLLQLGIPDFVSKVSADEQLFLAADTLRHVQTPNVQVLGRTPFPVMSGGPVVNVFGGLVGISRVMADGDSFQDRMIDVSALRDFLGESWGYWPWFWTDFRGWFRTLIRLCSHDFYLNYRNVPKYNIRWGFGVGSTYDRQMLIPDSLGRREYYGALCDTLPDGPGCLQYADGSCYRGNWSQGKRSGYGCYVDSVGRFYVGLWEQDTLVFGIRKDSVGYFRGRFDAWLRPSGSGELGTVSGTYYTGAWHRGEKHGFGMDIAPDRLVHCGIWRNGSFRGERMVYTADRVYGIDISRYQHEIGRHVYPIDWTKMRITHLSRADKKQVLGDVDYPVSYVYIKATEGLRIRNRYYTADASRARRHQIPVGAYHFFTTAPARRQAEFFLRTARPKVGDLPPMLDVELSDARIRSMGGEEVLFREIMTWMRIVGERCGVRPLLYVSQSFVNRYMDHAPKELLDYDVWIARYGAYRPYVHLLHWQISPDGRVAGIRGDVDIDVFNGTKEQFEEYKRRERVSKSPW